MSDLRELYQEVILDHNKRPRNFRALAAAEREVGEAGAVGEVRKAEGYNPLCGDRITVYLEMEGDRIRDVSFQGSGCAISKASASMMTDSVKGKTVEEAEDLFQRFHQMVTAPLGAMQPDAEQLGKLSVFAGVREYPVRVKCASLAWHTLRAAVEAKAEVVSTE